MWNPLRKAAPRPLPTGPAGLRIYALGDVHGRIDLLDQLLAQIRADHAARPPADHRIILLGDLIDRGPASAAVIQRVIDEEIAGAPIVALRGNHEAALLAALDGERPMLALWLGNGGREALLSWGIEASLLDNGSTDEILAEARALIPLSHRRWMARRPTHVRFGDYLFVHAGIRPGVKIDRQVEKDLLWIRDEFLSSDRDHGCVIVHGHSVTHGVEERPNRIGLDTGAYATGRLTAIGVEGVDRWYLSTRPHAAD